MDCAGEEAESVNAAVEVAVAANIAAPASAAIASLFRTHANILSSFGVKSALKPFLAMHFGAAVLSKINTHSSDQF